MRLCPYVPRIQCGHSCLEIQIIYYNYSDILEQESTLKKTSRRPAHAGTGRHTLDPCAAPAYCTA